MTVKLSALSIEPCDHSLGVPHVSQQPHEMDREDKLV